MAQTSVKSIAMSSFSSASLTGSYQVVNTGGIPKACFLLRVTNAGSTTVTFSLDGVSDTDQVPAGQSCAVNAQANGQPSAQEALWAIGTTIYVKGTAGTGNISVSGYYV